MDVKMQMVPICDSFTETQNGSGAVPLPSTPKAWMECRRDLARMLDSGRVYIVGQQNSGLECPVPGVSAGGAIGVDECNAAFESLSQAVSAEILAQHGTSSAASASFCLGSFQQIAEQASVHLNVTAAMHVAALHGLPPLLHQPIFLVCIGRGQVRVMTLAFIGTAVSGVRPSCKRTPWMLQCVSEDLVPLAAFALEGRLRSNTVQVQFSLQHVPSGVETTEDIVTRHEAEFGHPLCMTVYSKVATRLMLNPTLPSRPRVSSGLSALPPVESRSRTCSSVTRFSDEGYEFLGDEGPLDHDVPYASSRPRLASRHGACAVVNTEARSRTCSSWEVGDELHHYLNRTVMRSPRPHNFAITVH